jgi:hypothetical protein
VSRAEATKEAILLPALASACQDHTFADLRPVERRGGEAQFRTSSVTECRSDCRTQVKGQLRAVKDPCASLTRNVAISTIY